MKNAQLFAAFGMQLSLSLPPELIVHPLKVKLDDEDCAELNDWFIVGCPAETENAEGKASKNIAVIKNNLSCDIFYHIMNKTLAYTELVCNFPCAECLFFHAVKFVYA